MKRKNILIGFFVSLLLFQFVGYFTYFNFEKSNIKKQIKLYLKKGVPINELKTFVFSKHEFNKLHFIEKEKEFKLNGKFYDIVKKSYKNNEIHLFCIDDLKESQLFNQLDLFVNNNFNHSDKNNHSVQIFNLTNSPYLINKQTTIKIIDNNYEIEKKQFDYSFSIITYSQKIIIPPPEA
ncbi:MAG: hypothetical protein HYU67_04260 [Flavobacteriia bacterium]|nr:hypothetical protein [Flavobacteriia bacterium]